MNDSTAKSLMAIEDAALLLVNLAVTEAVSPSTYTLRAHVNAHIEFGEVLRREGISIEKYSAS